MAAVVREGGARSGVRWVVSAALLALSACLGPPPGASVSMSPDAGDADGAASPDAFTTEVREGGTAPDATTGGTDANGEAGPEVSGDAGTGAPPPPAGSAVAALFLRQPMSVIVGAQEPTIQVELVDTTGHVVTTAANHVVLSLANLGSSAFIGVAAADPVGGVASFPDLGFSVPGNGYTLVATPLGLPPVTSNPFNVTTAPFSLVDTGSYGGKITSIAMGTLLGNSGAYPAGYALTPGGVYRMLNQQGIWGPSSFGTALNSGLPVSDGRLAVDPTDVMIAYLSSSQGLFKTIDGGSLWLLIGAGDPSCFVVDAAHPQNLYTGSQRSTDGGNTWSTNGFAYKCLSLAIDPTTSALYATAGNPTTGAALGFYKSIDSAITWNPTTNPAPDAGTASLGAVYATASGVFVNAGGGLRRSTDGGATWALVAPFYAAIAGAPSNPMRVYAVTSSPVGSVAVSNDGGATFGASISTGPPILTPIDEVTGIAVDPSNADRVFAATWQGVVASLDGGATWSADSKGISYAPFSTAAVDPANPATANAGFPGTVLHTTDGGQTWAQTALAGSPQLNVDPATPSRIYACSGSALSISSNEGLTWGPPITTGVGCRSPMLIRGQSLMMPNTAASSGTFTGIAVSTNGGATWTTTATALNGLLFSLAFDPSGANLYAGTDSGTYKSTNGGSTWTSMVPTDLATAMLVDPITPTTIYAGLGCGSADNAPQVTGGGGVKRSIDSGATWTGVTGSGSCVSGMLGLPSGTLYAYGSRGVMKSTDRAMTWTVLGGAELQETSGLAVSNDGLTVYAATAAGLYKSTTGGI